MTRAIEKYWKANLRFIAGVLVVWAAASFGAGILFADRLDAGEAVRLPGRLLVRDAGRDGRTFVVLMFVYVKLMNALDRRFGVYEE